MHDKLDIILCERYPKIFRDRYANMQTTCMCWGFEIGDGWFNIIDRLCANIQNHVDWARHRRLQDLLFNRALKAALAGDKSKLIKFYTRNSKISEFILADVESAISLAKYKEVKEKVYQVVAVQVKEKFGSLRFYYDGGDDTVDGMIRMAESMSGVTCEECGASAKPIASKTGWVVATLCDTHKTTQEEYRNSILKAHDLK